MDDSGNESGEEYVCFLSYILHNYILSYIYVYIYIFHVDVFDRCFIHRMFTICPCSQKEVCHSPFSLPVDCVQQNICFQVDLYRLLHCIKV